MHASFQLPIWFDLGATFAFALTGALAALKRGYDVVGLISLALVSGIGGGLIRDGIFLQQGLTPLLTNPNYLYVIGAAALGGVLLGERVHQFNRVIAMVDALGLGAYACFGVQKSLQAGLGPTAAVLVGVVNAVGGGLLRDVLTREEPLVFRPGQFYVLVALAGAVTFVFLTAQLGVSATIAAFAAIGLTFVFRMLTIVFNWRTGALAAGQKKSAPI
jgi:uncharacterized membrane protein YeiH